MLLTLNQRVPGSSPGAPTIAINVLATSAPHRTRTVLQFILQFFSRFELQHRRFGELNIAAEIVRVQNGFDVLQAVAGERRDLRHRGAGDGEAHHRRTSEVMKGEVVDAGSIRKLAPRRPEPVGGPRAAQRVGRIIGPRRGVASSRAFSGAPAGITMRRPVLDCCSRICVPS